MSWLDTVEFYVIAGAVAAAVVALTALPQRRRESRLYTLAGELSDSGGHCSPVLEVYVDDNRRVILTRRGLPDVGDTSAASLAVNVAGFDIVIEERLTHGRGATAPRDTAVFVLDFLAPERYHIRYNGEDAGVFTAFTLPVREGITLRRSLGPH